MTAACTAVFVALYAGSGSAQNLDTAFNPGANFTVMEVLVQPDGKILVAGFFTMIGGGGQGTTPRNYIARLNADGSVDSSFNPGANDWINTIALQPDGKIVVGGWFTKLGGGTGTISRNRIGRLNPDGSVDETFNPGASGNVESLAIQPDGKILVGGIFMTLAGVNRPYFGRLHPNGTLDTEFFRAPSSIVGIPYRIIAEPNGRILVANGDIATPGPAVPPSTGPCGSSPTNPTTLVRGGVVRLLPDGCIDPDFAGVGFNSTVHAIAPQSDGKVFVGGAFTTVYVPDETITRRYLARLNGDGTLDRDFNPGADSTVYELASEPGDRLLVGGNFGALGGGTGSTPRNRVGRLLANGTVDASFDPGANDIVRSFARQADGKVVVGGQFGKFGGGGSGTNERRTLARLMSSCSTLALTPPALPNGNIGLVYPSTQLAHSGTNPATIALTAGALPPGLSLSPSGLLTGTPTRVGSYPVTIRVTDATGCTGSRSYTTYVAACPLVFNVTHQSNPPNALPPEDYYKAFGRALAYYQNLFCDPITVNMTVIWGTLTPFATTSPNFAGESTYPATRAQLTADGSGADDAAAAASLPASDPLPAGRAIVSTRAQAKALRSLTDSGESDGTIQFNSNVAWSYDTVNRAVPGKYDFVAAAHHEITHLLGRVSAFQSPTFLGCCSSPVDLFRFTAPGARQVSPACGAGHYFSLDSGITNLRPFNTTCGADLTDWMTLPPVYDAYNAFASTGHKHAMSPENLRMMDVLGYDRVRFTDDPLVRGVTTVKAAHITELRTRIDGLRAVHDLPPFVYTQPLITVAASVIRATDVLELRTALAAVYAAAGMVPPIYLSAPHAGGPIAAADIEDLRTAVKFVESHY